MKNKITLAALLLAAVMVTPSYGVSPRALRTLQNMLEIMRHESIETTMKYYVGKNAERTAAIMDTVEKQSAKQDALYLSKPTRALSGLAS